MMASELESLRLEREAYQQRKAEEASLESGIQKWKKSVIIAYLSIGMFVFSGFLLVGFEVNVGVGSIMCVAALLAAFISPFVFASKHPAAAGLNGQVKEKTGATLLRALALFGISVGSFLLFTVLSAVAAIAMGYESDADESSSRPSIAEYYEFSDNNDKNN